ncbi:MAG TPA: thiamine-phosphate kinase [Marinilabiliaceae bacterium]|nr:thiamine-phosphate kinase [Marinilabiliaceae bacterium]
MNLSEIGEFGFIERFASKFNHLLPSGVHGIGDDCAVLPMNETHDLVMTTDLLVEGIHFLKDKISPKDLGHKTLAVNLSDIAAMGAQPIASFLSIAIPSSTKVEYLDSFMEGYHTLSEKHNVALMGGDTARALDKLTFNVTVMGKIEKGKSRLRSMAKENDIIAVTGYLGNSAGGLHAVLNNLSLEDASVNYLIQQHNRPIPHIHEGLWLAQQKRVHAMMDVSDGIASDINHILKASVKGATIELTSLPLSHQLKEFSEKQKLNMYDLGTSGGEDYCLLVTIDKDHFNDLAERYKKEFHQDLFPIGEINSSSSLQFLLKNEKIELTKSGFNHFIL